MPRKKTFKLMSEPDLMIQMLKDHGFSAQKPNNNRGSSDFGSTTLKHWQKGDYVQVQHRDHDVPASAYGKGYQVAKAGSFHFMPSTSYNSMGTRVPRKSVPTFHDQDMTTSPRPTEPTQSMRDQAYFAGMTGGAPSQELQNWAANATAPEPDKRGHGSKELRSVLHQFGHRGQNESTDYDMILSEITGNREYKDHLKSGGAKVDRTTKPGGAPGSPGTKKPGTEPPTLPKTLNPADVHGYYMSMADYHDKKAWTNKRISGLKPLWSDDRNMHDDRHLFHRAMRDGFAQKALAVDLAAPTDGQAGFQGMKESLNESRFPDRVQVADRTLTIEQFVERYGEAPIHALRSGKIDRFTIVSGEQYEAFSGTAPTGSLNTVNQNKSASAKPLPLQHPFPSSAPKPAVPKMGKIPTMPKMAKTAEATMKVANGADPFEALETLTRF